jgi:hypothetical protein
MDKKLNGIYWGLILIAGGGIVIAQNMGYLNDISPIMCIAGFSVISLISLLSYLFSSARSWSMLFPAGIFGGLAILIGMAVNGVNHPSMAAPLMMGVAVPFGIAYFEDRKRNWWALIPMSLMVFLTFVLVVVNTLGGEIIGASMFFLMATAFLITYQKKQAPWAALVAYILFMMGFLPLLAASPHPEIAGVLIFFAAALPFIRISIKTPEKWWAIIPAGIMMSIGLTVLVSLTLHQMVRFESPNLPTALTLAGTALTFALVRLRIQKSWAGYAALIFVLGAAAAFFIQNMLVYWPVIIILSGLCLLVMALRTQTA